MPDLGSHLLDTCRFWFGDNLGAFELLSANRFENKSPDHVVIGTTGNFLPRIELEMTLCMWRNHFTCDILAENGTAHIESLCKWGPSTFTHRMRVLPSGRPPETQVTLAQLDPTWTSEYDHFKSLVRSKVCSDLSKDYWLQRNLRLKSQSPRLKPMLHQSRKQKPPVTNPKPQPNPKTKKSPQSPNSGN